MTNLEQRLSLGHKGQHKFTICTNGIHIQHKESTHNTVRVLVIWTRGSLYYSERALQFDEPREESQTYLHHSWQCIPSKTLKEHLSKIHIINIQ